MNGLHNKLALITFILALVGSFTNTITPIDHFQLNMMGFALLILAGIEDLKPRIA